ncbi:MAG: URC4/urg3 family protein [Deltaproteobacteria bacterium]|nr:URC4/urg3 family protein [Deltaproteobacteria bacterium]
MSAETTASGGELTAALNYLKSPLAIRARAENVLSVGLVGGLDHFAVELARLGAVADRVAAVTRAAYPSLVIPVHGRTNHFRAGGVDRAAALDRALADRERDARATAWIDLIVVSVLLDAGAGDAWAFTEPGTGLRLARSEGLAVASLHAFQEGLFSADPADPLRVDADALARLDPDRLAAAFQISAANPMVGLEGRTELVRRLGAALVASPQLFPDQRPGGLLEVLRTGGPAARGGGTGALGGIAAAELLRALLDGLGSIWPGRTELAGANLGDVWRHPAAGGEGPTAGLAPFHKLSQWLAYSLFEPIEQAGLRIIQPGALTGLPEYRNGGLLVDLGVLVPRHAGVLRDRHKPGSEIVVEWRALTVALLDRVADLVRARLEKSADELPLARVLEGGTWAAGRAVAAELRPGGGPPITIESDGTVF